jgi:hypothetical protein
MNVFLIGTPHQLLNAIEARNSLGLTEDQVVLSLSGVYPRGAFEPILRDHAADRIHYVGVMRAGGLGRVCSRWNPWFQRATMLLDELRQRQRLDAMARKLRGARTLILGNYGMVYMRHFANRIGCPNLMLLDDGTATLEVNQQRRLLAAGRGGVQGGKTRQQLWRDWIGFDSGHPKRVTFFTTYELDLAEGDSMIKNDYSYIRSLAAGVDAQECVYFVGQPLVEDSLISMERLLARFERVRAHFAGERFIYLPHKRERADKVRDLQERFQFEVKSFDVPIEYQMSVRGTRPKVLASFFSSALENSRVIFGPLVRIKSFRVDPEDFLGRREEIVSIYAYYAGKQSEHFEVIG